MAGYFDYLNPRSTEDYDARMSKIEQYLGITAPGSTGSTPVTTASSSKKTPTTPFGEPVIDQFGYPTGSLGTGTLKLKDLLRISTEPGIAALTEMREKDQQIKASAPDYAEYLKTAVERGQKSEVEAQDLFADFAKAYGVEGGYKTAAELGGLTRGVAPESAVERYRPFQKFAAQTLGLNLTEEDIKGTEQAARVLGKTSPEAFSELLGKRMTTSPEYIRKTPLAFTANLPFGGKYGVGYQTPEGTFTGTYRFKPPSTVNYA